MKPKSNPNDIDGILKTHLPSAPLDEIEQAGERVLRRILASHKEEAGRSRARLRITAADS